MKFLKSLITTFLAFYLSLCPIKAQEIPKQVTVNKRKFSMLEDKVVDEHNIIIKDRKTLFKILKTLQIQEAINSQQLNSKALRFLELYAKGQELTIKYNEHIDWTLRLPAKILANIVLGQPTNLEDLANEFKDLTINKLKQSANDIANNPEKQLKHLAYKYFSQANKKVKFNLIILRKKQQLDYKTAKQFEENSYFIDTYIKPSQQLYHDIENLRKLEERWTQTFLQEINKTLPKGIDKITDLLLQKYENIIQKRLEQLKPYEKFKESIAKKKQELHKLKSKKDKSLEKRAKELIKKINFDNNIIVYVSDLTGNFEIYSMTKDGKNKIQLTYNGSKNLFPKWTPKKKIIFCSNLSGNFDLYLIDITGTFVQQLTKTQGNEGGAIILSNGDMVFISDKNGNNDIYLKESLGDTKQLTKTKEDESDLEISPNEKWLCFERDLENDYDKEKEGIFILNLKNGLERKIDDNGYYPKFSPEGKVSYMNGIFWIKTKNIYGNLQQSKFPNKEKCMEIGYPKYLKELSYIPKEPNTKPHVIYLLGWIDKNTIIHRADLIKLPEKKLIKNFYSFNFKTNQLKKLTNNDIGVWNDHADCLRK